MMVRGKRPLVLLAEDDDEIRWALTDFLSNDGFVVTAVENGDQLARSFREMCDGGAPPDVVVTDHRMPGRLGVDVLAALGAWAAAVPVIVITAFGPDVEERAYALGARAVFKKPFDTDDLRTAVWFWSSSHRREPRQRGARLLEME